MIEYRYRDEGLGYEELRALEKVCFPDDDLSETQYEGRLLCDSWTARTEGGALAGYACCGVRGGGIHLSRLGVAREYRREGIGTKLIRLAADRARELGSPFLTLCVLQGNAPARALYEKAGFREFGTPLRRYSIAPGEMPEAEPLEFTREDEGYKYALRFQRGGADVGGGVYNEEIGGLKDFVLADPADLAGALRALRGLLRKEQDRLYVMTDDAPTAAACEASPLRLWSVILNMRLAL